MQLFLGIDLGTTNFKAGLFDANGRLCGLGRRSVNKDTANNTCELPVHRFWSTIRACIAEALAQAGARAQDIYAMSYASQANSFILLDKNDQPLTPLVLWPDTRGGDVHPELQRLCSQPEWSRKTGMGLPLSPHSCINKLKWYAAQTALWHEVGMVLTISDYLTYTLTGQKQGDASSASLLGMLDVRTCTWWQEALSAIPLQPNQLVTPGRTGSAAGMVTEKGAALTGLQTGTLYFLGGLDHHIAALGAGVMLHPTTTESTGTVLAAVQYTNGYQPKPWVCVGPGLDEDHFFAMAFDDHGGGFLAWYQQTQAPELSIEQLLSMAEKTTGPGDGLLAVKRMEGNLEVYGFEGVQAHHGHGHFVRAILELTAHRLDLLLQRLPEETYRIASTGGGARSRYWAQVKASVTGKLFKLPENNETACAGAAMLAATGAAIYPNIDAAMTSWIKYKESIEFD